MSWLILIFILACYYWFFVADRVPEMSRPSVPEPRPQPFHYEFKSRNDVIGFYNSLGQRWEFHVPEPYYVRDGKIQMKNVCFGKADGSHVKAEGRTLYDHVVNEKLKDDPSGPFQTLVNGAVYRGHLFYFNCVGNEIEGLYTCPPGQFFDKTKCVSVNPCTNLPDGAFVPDEFDRRFYYECPDTRLQCPPKTFFMFDSCRSESDLTHVCLNDPSFVLPLSDTSFLKCFSGIPKFYTCPPGTIFSERDCVPDLCFNKPDGFKVGFQTEPFGPFRYSSGYYVCQGNRVRQSVQCPSYWDRYESDEQLTFLPQVFENGECTVPKFCKNVTVDHPDVVVPSHSFTKDVKNWRNSLLFDCSVGYRCDGNRREEFVPPPGHWIYNFKSTFACTEPGQKVVLGGDKRGYFDCDSDAIVPCPDGTFFDGTHCKSAIPNAHRYKGIDMFAFDPLENNWMVPWTHSPQNTVSCTPPEHVYVPGYNICSHPDCEKFPFLKQFKGHIQLDELHKCVFENDKISKVKTAKRHHFNFWTQRKSFKKELCVPGSKVKTGHFVLDSVLYATCDAEQPFVFCPSSSTIGIRNIHKTFACDPEPSVFEGTLKANTFKRFLENHLAKIIPQPGARVIVNGKFIANTDPDGIRMGPQEVEIWSDRDVTLIYKTVVTHPPNCYFQNKVLKAFEGKDELFLIRYGTRSTRAPIELKFYDVRESVDGFRSDAT
ncbi:hypothetical protein AVEN_34099-1 [Araneus ventricosus]|uniref:Chitin-binding type-2 domain-containing protein n=1 Tax=Araneus ventricosus TaxID=182803 RepID=A0A4Y2WA61_ARAVE|nr:hypothetical protein AVEN_34099-1 [Araneus ventricosus]